MGDKSSIQWTDATWNPVTGCSKVSPGCAHCYAESLTRRFASTWGVPDLPWTPENAKENVILHPERLDQPLRWKRPRMVFVNSMSDLFHEEVSDEFILRVFDVMRSAYVEERGHVFQVLTKRPERMRDFCLRVRFDGGTEHGRMWLTKDGERDTGYALMGGRPGCKPLPNVWLGVSIENRRYVHRADLLRETPAAVRFISAEPLLGPLVHEEGCLDDDKRSYWYDGYEGPQLDLTGIDWLIAGGESGPGHRPMHADWLRDLRDACWSVDNDRGDAIAFFFKQWGGATPKAGGRELDGRTWDEMPTRAEVSA